MMYQVPFFFVAFVCSTQYGLPSFVILISLACNMSSPAFLFSKEFGTTTYHPTYYQISLASSV